MFLRERRFPFGKVCDVPGFGRMTGKLIFVRSEYVEEVKFTDRERTVVYSEIWGSSTHTWSANVIYKDFPF